VLKAAVILVALVEAVAILAFGGFAVSGDDLGIATAMVVLLLGPFALTTVPAQILMIRGRLLAASMLVAVSVPLMWLVWSFA
jgi:hypothetical protein